MFFWLLLIATIGVTYYYFFQLRKNFLPTNGKVVVISGCDSGFGLATALQLSERGCKVLAGCLTDKGIEALKGKKNIVPFSLDISNSESIQKSYKIIQDNCPNGLWALINNAGIAKGSILDFTPVDTYRQVLQVNLLGHIEMTKLCLQLLKKTKGRLINMASIAGKITSPGMSAYNCSKYGMIAFSNAIRPELAIWGITVISIAPGFMKTNIISIDNIMRTIEDSKKLASKEVYEMYGDEYFATVTERVKKISEIGGDPQQVIDTYIHATLSTYPKYEYNVGKDAWVCAFIAMLPHSLQIIFTSFISPQALPKVLREMGK